MSIARVIRQQDLWAGLMFMAFAFGVMGYVFVKIDCEPAPLLPGFILGPLLEEYFLRALIMLHGDLTHFVRNPISGTIIALAVILLLIVVLPSIKRKREEAFQE